MAIDDTVHPFAIRIGGGDVRITTRWDEHYIGTGLYGAMHECGHGLYEPVFRTRCRALRSAAANRSACTSLRAGCGNMVGRGALLRCAGAPHRGPVRRPGRGLDADTLYRAVNRVRPSYIRVEADEASMRCMSCCASSSNRS